VGSGRRRQRASRWGLRHDFEVWQRRRCVLAAVGRHHHVVHDAQRGLDLAQRALREDALRAPRLEHPLDGGLHA